MMNRRLLLMMLVLGLAAQGPAAAWADDDDDGHDNHSGDGGKGDGKDDEGGGRDSSTGTGGDDGGDNERNGGSNQRGRNDNDEWIRREVSAGKVAPLRKILATVREQYGGQVVRVRLTGRGAKRMYRIRIIDTSNQLIEVQVNASTGNIVVPSGIY